MVLATFVGVLFIPALFVLFEVVSMRFARKTHRYKRPIKSAE
jgi:hypothetical protein